MSRKSFCYKTLETYDKPRNQLKSFCKDGGNSGYYNISSTRGICNDDGDCRVRENFQPIPASEWQQPASVRGTWDQVKGLYELNPQSNSCVSDWKNREGYGNAAATAAAPPARWPPPTVPPPPCTPGQTWSDTGLAPCVYCNTCPLYGIQTKCTVKTDSVCNPPPASRERDNLPPRHL